MVSMYRIREIDGHDEEMAEILAELHRRTFFDAASIPEFEQGSWWLAYRGIEPAGFAGLIPSTHVRNAGYFSRVGVLSHHRGNALQLRLMRAIEARARLNGWCSVVSDTPDKLPSANKFIRGGYRRFRPKWPWGWSSTLYWRKLIR
jgi:GNAT superfamily N-acetyltransferase